MEAAQRQALEQVHAAWRRFTGALERVPRERMEEPGVVGPWSVKDLVGHVSTWEAETMGALRRLQRGEGEARYPDVDSFNAREVERKRGLSLERLLGELECTHRELLAFLEGLPAALLAEGGYGRRRVAQDTYEHYLEHTADLERWLEASAARGA